MTENQIAPQADSIRRARESGIATTRGAGAAASAILQGVAPNTQQAYILAAREMAALGRGSTAGLQDRVAASRTQADEFAASQGTPAPAPEIDTAKQADTLYRGGVIIPGSSLESQGAAATAANEGLVASSAIKTQADIHQLEQKSEQDLLDLAAKRPELHDQIMDTLFKRELDKMQGRIQSRAQSLYESQFGEKVRHDVAGERTANRRADISARRANIAERNYQLAVQKHQFAVDQAQKEGRTIDPSASKVAGHLVDQSGNPILDHRGNKIPVAVSAGGGKGGGLTPAQRRSNVRMAGTAANKLYKDAQPTPNPYPIPGAKPGAPGGPIAAKHPMTFAQAQGYLVATYGLARSKARQLLIAAGWKPDGKRRQTYQNRGN